MGFQGVGQAIEGIRGGRTRGSLRQGGVEALAPEQPGRQPLPRGGRLEQAMRVDPVNRAIRRGRAGGNAARRPVA